MRKAHTHTTERRRGLSLARGPAGLLGLAMVAFGLIGLLWNADFSASPLSGAVQGDTFLGIEVNGWDNFLLIGAGALLMFGAMQHAAAKTFALVLGLGFAALTIIGLIQGQAALGIFAGNTWTAVLGGALAAGLLIIALLPRTGKREKHVEHERADGHRRGRFRRDERAAPEREPAGPRH